MNVSVQETEETRPQRFGNLFVSFTTLVSGTAIIVHLTRYNGLTPIGEAFLLVNAVFLLFVPMLIVFVLFRERAEQFGFKPSENNATFVAFLFFAGMAPILLIASRFPMFQNYYPMRPQAAYSWSFFLYWELTYGFYMFCWEFFYRGFLTFGLTRGFGPTVAILLQTLGFGLMHWGKPAPEFAGSFIAGLALGWLALRGKSFLPCFAVHWAVSIAFDILAIRAKQGAIF